MHQSCTERYKNDDQRLMTRPPSPNNRSIAKPATRVLGICETTSDCEALRDYAEILGWMIDTVDCTKRAVEIAWRTRYDLIISGQNFRKMSGIEAIKVLRSPRSANHRTPVLLTAPNLTDHALRMMARLEIDVIDEPPLLLHHVSRFEAKHRGK